MKFIYVFITLGLVGGFAYLSSISADYVKKQKNIDIFKKGNTDTL